MANPQVAEDHGEERQILLVHGNGSALSGLAQWRVLSFVHNERVRWPSLAIARNRNLLGTADSIIYLQAVISTYGLLRQLWSP